MHVKNFGVLERQLRCQWIMEAIVFIPYKMNKYVSIAIYYMIKILRVLQQSY
jgi:hypothetical protein